MGFYRHTCTQTYRHTIIHAYGPLVDILDPSTNPQRAITLGNENGAPKVAVEPVGLYKRRSGHHAGHPAGTPWYANTHACINADMHT